ncbi:alpha/beta fold hydrolase [Streptomyces sp. NPDC046853]|uniref:thioesterase II family protein n=1 Tax=Streptomyces sp. NPDC046853 TaxID=3154920 RepID=UPI00340F19B7
MKLFCLPYAGSSAHLIYNGWRGRAPEPVDVVPLELPGRGSLCTRPPVSVLDELMDFLATTVEANIPENETGRYAIFGHSFGAVLGFELAKTLQARGAASPVAVFVSACPPPHLAPRGPAVHTYSDHDIKEHLRALRGTPAELLENDELFALYLPSLRADYAILGAYRADRSARIGAPVVALTGTRDEAVSADCVRAWEQYTTGGFRSASIVGDHFFLTTAADEVIASVAEWLQHA